MEVTSVCQGGQQAGIFNNDITTAQSTGNHETSSKDVLTSNDNKKVSENDVKKAVDKFNKLLEDKSTHLEYEVYGKFKDIVVRVVDDNTKDVIQEVPPKNIIDMIDKFCEMAGVFVDKKA